VPPLCSSGPTKSPGGGHSSGGAAFGPRPSVMASREPWW
jgi:hypothetical protein